MIYDNAQKMFVCERDKLLCANHWIARGLSDYAEDRQLCANLYEHNSTT